MIEIFRIARLLGDVLEKNKTLVDGLGDNAFIKVKFIFIPTNLQ